MWGDPQTRGLLLQVTGPSHIPLNDPRWQELLHGYNVWVHIEHDGSSGSEFVPLACVSLTKHATTSSNLAALALHVSRMVREVQTSVIRNASHNNNDDDDNDDMDVTRRLALAGKARATAGSLRLLRTLLRDVMVATAAGSSSSSNSSSSSSRNTPSLEEMFVYRSREFSQRGTVHRNAGSELVSSLLSLLSTMGTTTTTAHSSNPTATATATASSPLAQLTSVPELYDATVLALELVLVLLSSQLYQPLQSSAQQQQQQHVRQTNRAANDNNNEDLDKDHQSNYFLDWIMTEATNQQHQQHHDTSLDWTPQSVLQACLVWIIHRPPAPPRSIARHMSELARSMVQAKGEKIGPDGMYESHKLVTAVTKEDPSKHYGYRDGGGSDRHGPEGSGGSHTTRNHRRRSKVIVDATKGVLVLSSSLIMLPFRLMSLALGLWGYRYKHQQHLLAPGADGYDPSRILHLHSSTGSSSSSSSNPPRRPRTNDVLWLTNSPVTDMACTIFLLLTNNYRAPPPSSPLPEKGLNVERNRQQSRGGNPFRAKLESLNDNRWEGSEHLVNPPGTVLSLDSLAHPVPTGTAAAAAAGEDLDCSELEPLDDDSSIRGKDASSNSTSQPRFPQKGAHQQLLTTNFESLFDAFGTTLHTEVGALVLYTVLQSSPIFAASMAVRSDLDTLVLPLLRTLYFSSTLHQYSSQDYPNSLSSPQRNGDDTPQSTSLSIRNCPFRSPSQLYVILILLLLFSQDASFGPDAFRRVQVSDIAWYKERNLRDINLGSVMVLTLLRCITFNINRLHDAFMLGNCCAILMNLSPNVVNLHEYAAMRLASVTVSAMKRYSKLVRQSGGKVSNEEDITTVVGMYGEVTRTLLRLVQHCIRPKNIDNNLHLVYSLVYCKTEFQSVVSRTSCPFTNTEIGCISAVISKADSLIQESGEARTAQKAFTLLEQSMDQLKAAALPGHLSRDKSKEISSPSHDTGVEDSSDFTFTYEEEVDPEIFFIPYLWEVVVCVVAAGSIDWDANRIQVFPLLKLSQSPRQMGME